MRRSAHAARSLPLADTPPRRHELATGLAHWAASYQRLPGTPVPTGALALPEARERVPALPVTDRGNGLIYDEAAKVERVGGFPEAVEALASPTSVQESLSELTRTMAGWFLANQDYDPVTFVHGVTAPAALRLLLRHLPASAHEVAFSYLWQAMCCAPIRLRHPGASRAGK
jgi:hypothetical protein